jgi:hypothetical protein
MVMDTPEEEGAACTLDVTGLGGEASQVMAWPVAGARLTAPTPSWHSAKAAEAARLSAANKHVPANLERRPRDFCSEFIM